MTLEKWGLFQRSQRVVNPLRHLVSEPVQLKMKICRSLLRPVHRAVREIDRLGRGSLDARLPMVPQDRMSREMESCALRMLARRALPCPR